MPSANRVIIAAAGSGKTTEVVQEAISRPHKNIAIISYTINNVDEIRKKFYELHGTVPGHVTISTWFTFLLRECARPYQNYLYSDSRIESINFIDGISAQYVKKTNVKSYYFSRGRDIYADKIAEFVCRCNEESNGLVIERLSQIYDEILIDEVQDLAGHDLELIELLLKSTIKILMVGDNRQATYSTNNSAKNKKYRGIKIVDVFHKWEKSKLCTITYLSHSYRCNQAICDFADRLYPDMPKTISENQETTDHDGIFLIPDRTVEQYVARYSPVLLRYDRTTSCLGHEAMNFGESKGLTFDRVLIFPNGPIQKYLSTGDIAYMIKSCAKFYVAITRAKYSVVFVYSGKCNVEGVSAFHLGQSTLIALKQPTTQQSLWETTSNS